MPSSQGINGEIFAEKSHATLAVHETSDETIPDFPI